MQYSVPQFIDVEDKIIGPLTLRQFLVVLAGGITVFALWKLFSASVYFFLALLPTVGLFAGLAFGRFNGRPFLVNAADFVKFFLAPKRRIFMHETDRIAFLSPQPAGANRAPEGGGAAERSSRLRRLAYLLDQKTAEEERLIHSGKVGETWLNKI